ncbi:MAG: hypothetical protein HKM07_00320 [Chlamydiae bacterium]|nr:hypothetical protein [Chlamydiota bacterium]
MSSSPIHPFFTENMREVTHYLDCIINKKPHLGLTHPPIQEAMGALSSFVTFLFKPKEEYEYSLGLQLKVNEVADPEEIDSTAMDLFRGLVTSQVKIDQATHLRNYRSSLVTAALLIDTGLLYLSAKANKSSQVYTILKVASYLSYLVTAGLGLYAFVSWHREKPSQETISQIAQDAIRVRLLLQPHPVTTTSAAAASLPPTIAASDDDKISTPPPETTGPSTSTAGQPGVQQGHVEGTAPPVLAGGLHFAILPKPPQLTPEHVFLNLTLTELDQTTIRTLITLTAETGLMDLAKKRDEMLGLGKSVMHVHPLRFLDFVFSDMQLSQAMKKIEDSTLRWRGFIDGTGSGGPGFSQRLKDVHSINNFLNHVEGFCKRQGLTEQAGKIRGMARTGDWVDLVKFLIKAKCK